MIKKFFKKIFGIRDNEISFRQSYDLTELAVITFYQGETRLNLLFDSGSNLNIIDKGILPKLEYELTEDKIDMQGLEGVTREQQDECVIKITHKDVTYECPFTISDLANPFSSIKKESGVTLHGIIGTVFFNKYKYVLDFDKLVAYSKL